MNESQLIEAVKAGDVDRVQSLIEAGFDLEQKDDYGWTALNWAAGRGDAAIVGGLLEAGANAFNCGRDLRSPYQIALAAARVEAASLLQKVELALGMVSEKSLRPYCKAYPIQSFAQFEGWQPSQALSEDSIVYLHHDLSVTQSMWHGEDVLFDRISDDWMHFCSEFLCFHAPGDLELAEQFRRATA